MDYERDSIMNRTTLLTALTLAAIVITSSPTLAMRDPGQGPDSARRSGMPLYNYGPKPPAPPRIGQAGLNNQYADGMNLYEYVRSQPISSVDPQGLAAWKHTKWWNNSWKKKYRAYVATNAKSYLGRTEDCADLTMLVLIDFAEKNGLPLTFWHGSGCTYVSKSCNFSSKKDFVKKVQKGIASADMFGASGKTFNTSYDKKIKNVRPGDVYVEAGHVSLVVGVAAPGKLSGGQQYKDKTKKDVIARKGVWDWDTQSPEKHPDHLEWIYNPASTKGYRIDYLNHTGSVNRKKAELKYNRLHSDFSGKFRFWGGGVFSNYKTWDGKTPLETECK